MTGQNLYDLCLSAIGQTPSTGHDLWETINQAGTQLCQESPWWWLREGPHDFAAVADQDFIDLPDDFDSVAAITTGTSAAVEQVTPDFIMRMQAGSVVASGSTGTAYVSFVTWSKQTGGETEPRPRMLHWPTPTADGSPTYSILYRRKWKPLTTSDNTAIPNVPAGALPALTAGCRALAMARELGANHPATVAEYALYRGSVELLKGSDARAQPSFGPIRGGAGSPRPGIGSFTWSLTP